MGCSALLILGLVLHVTHCLEILGEERVISISDNITAVLGEAVYLRCIYQGDDKVESAKWTRQFSSKSKSKALAGFSLSGAFSKHANFSKPGSTTNLTVQMNVPAVTAEGEYVCEFETEEGSFSENTFVTVVARPDIQVLVEAETINGTHYQSVSCSAVGGRPMPQIRWLVNGLPPLNDTEDSFTVTVSGTDHSNGTSTLSSVLRFPTHLQDEDTVTCEIQHPTLPSPKLTAAKVETYARPNVTIKTEMVQRGGNDFWEVSCISSGGRPDTDISLALNTNEKLQRENHTDSDMQRSSVFVPAVEYQGQNVTCVFDHPKFTHSESQVVTLPSFYLSGVQLLDSEPGKNSDDFQGTESLELHEGQSVTVIGFKVIGNLPRYNITCTKDNGPLPEGWKLDGSSLTGQGPVEHYHTGLYECVVSYYGYEATLRLNITVQPPVIQLVPPTIQVDLQTKDGHRVIECSAADAVPAANVSWLLPKGVSGVSWSNFTSHNGSHSVRGVFLLPACLPRELTAECVINHPAFEEPENRSITLPLCAHPNITISYATEWRDGEQYTKVDCSADSVASAAVLTWHVGDSDDNISSSLVSEPKIQADGLVSARSSVYFRSSLYAGQILTCRVKHLSLEASEKRTIHIPVREAPQLTASVVRQQDSDLWLAVCECRGEGVGTNLTWVLPNSVKGQTSLHSEYEGHKVKARLTYQFPLALHEGHNLTCVYRLKHGITDNRTVHIPRYYISAVKVLNHTTPLQSRHGGEPIIHRLALQENHHNQKILLRVEGNAPQYNLNCKRSDGSSVYMEGLAIVFQSKVTEQDEDLYTCWASFYHHKAAVQIQVEVTSKHKMSAVIAMSCISTGSAILIILVVAFWVCCTRQNRTQKMKESLSALTTLMQEPGSPVTEKPGVTEKNSKECAPLISYAIVIDLKSTV